jgi:hypothetical protein
MALRNLPRRFMRGIDIPEPKVKRLTGEEAKARMRLFMRACAVSDVRVFNPLIPVKS